ncbi:cerebellin 11 [Synchiropus splendidus]|uniref:cerebellin 11 n=1 Tax=Synchiropus splendidus TaxID=270530 RepID=UPI00237E7A53|nr:cerebellin 11 [Synchiropus splendidus]
MGLRTLLILPLLGFMLMESGSAQRGDSSVLAERLTAESIKKLEEKVAAVERWRNETDALQARLNDTVDMLERQKAEVEALKKESQEMRTRLAASEEVIKTLARKTNSIAVAFSTSLANVGEVYTGPCTEKTLIFKRVLTNTGEGYDVDTGVFTAPVEGLYYFSFSTYGYNTHLVGAILMKNNERQTSTYESASMDGSDSSTNSAVLHLAAGDRVYVELWDNARVFDNLNAHTTFAGFLIYPQLRD